jgi:putative PIN family toxin of toxin-antitoxin system
MNRVVMDTNVLVSALLKPQGNERRILRLIVSDRLQLVLSPAIFEEYEVVLPRPRLKLTPAEVSEALTTLRAVADWIAPSVTLDVSVDTADNKFLEGAETGRADYLVTGNRRHFPTRWKTTRIVDARELLRLIVPSKRRFER